MRRIFIAVDISDEARRKVSDYVETLRRAFPDVRAGWTRNEKLHLTIKFLGDIDGQLMDRLTEAVEKTAKKISNFRLRLGDTGVFPSTKKARTLWLDIKDETGSLSGMNELIETECEKIGFAREKRNFKAHLTIARLKEHSKGLTERHLQTKFEPVEFEVTDIVIYESKLQPEGSVYSVISKHKLQ